VEGVPDGYDSVRAVAASYPDPQYDLTLPSGFSTCCLFVLIIIIVVVVVVVVISRSSSCSSSSSSSVIQYTTQMFNLSRKNLSSPDEIKTEN